MAIEMANGADIAAAAGAAVGASVVVGATICESVVCIEWSEKMTAKENVRLMFAWCKEQVEPTVRRQWRGIQQLAGRMKAGRSVLRPGTVGRIHIWSMLCLSECAQTNFNVN